MVVNLRSILSFQSNSQFRAICRGKMPCREIMPWEMPWKRWLKRVLTEQKCREKDKLCQCPLPWPCRAVKMPWRSPGHSSKTLQLLNFLEKWRNSTEFPSILGFLMDFYVSCFFLNLWNFFNFFILTEWKYCSRLTFLQKNKKTKTVSKMLIYLLLLFSWQFSVEMDDCIVTNMNTTHTRFSSFEEISVSLFFSNRSERADCSDWIK